MEKYVISLYWAVTVFHNVSISVVSALQGRIQSLERGVHFVEKIEDQKKKKEEEEE